MLTRKIFAIAALAAMSTLTGCASIVNGQNQVISVEASHKGKPVTGARCELENPKGKFFVTTPGTITIHRAYDDLYVRCMKDGMPPGLASFKSSTKAMAFGNIVFGGVVGAAVDMKTGAAYDYPTLISISLGETSGLIPATAPTQASLVK